MPPDPGESGLPRHVLGTGVQYTTGRSACGSHSLPGRARAKRGEGRRIREESHEDDRVSAVSMRSIFEGTAEFRSVRLTLDDVRLIEKVLKRKNLVWSCTSRKSVVVVGSRKDPAYGDYKMSVREEAESLDGLMEVAPKGRIFDFMLEAAGANSIIKVKIGNPRSRSLVLESCGGGVEASFEEVFKILKRAENRSQIFHYLGIAFGPLVAILVPLMIFDQVSGIGIFHDADRPPHDVSIAATLAIFALLILWPICFGVWTWAMSASVQLKPRLNTASLSASARGAFRRPFSRLGNLYKADGSTENKLLFAAMTSMLVAFGSLIVALLAWVFPRN